jgi:hypothetical protein
MNRNEQGPTYSTFACCTARASFLRFELVQLLLVDSAAGDISYTPIGHIAGRCAVHRDNSTVTELSLPNLALRVALCGGRRPVFCDSRWAERLAVIGLRKTPPLF